MRLMIIGITALGLAALAMICADGRVLRALGIASLWGGDIMQVHFSTKEWTPKQRRDKMRIPAPQGKWKTMSGFPSYTSFLFPLPQHTPIESGRFVLEFSLQIPTSGGGAIRVLINDEKRAELLLEPTRKRYRVIIELNEIDLTKRYVSVALSADGYGAAGECPDDRSRIAILEIEPKTQIELQLATAITHVADAALLAGDPLRLLTPESDSQLARERVLGLALRLQQLGHTLTFVSKQYARGHTVIRVDPQIRTPRYERALNEIIVSGPDHATRIVSSIITTKSRGEPTLGYKGHFPIEALKTPVHNRKFQREINWKIDFNLNDMPNGQAPGQLDLALFRSIPGDAPSDLLSVTLNGNLLHSAPMGRASNPLVKKLRLPLSEIRLGNTIEIMILANEDRIGVCNPGRDAFAQLLKKTALAGFQLPHDAQAEYLPSRLALNGQLKIVAPHEMSRHSFRESLQLLARITPGSVKLASSKKHTPDPAVLATIIPLDRFRNEVGDFLSADIRQENSDKEQDTILPDNIWVATNSGSFEANAPDHRYARLTHALANTIIASDKKGVAIILSFPPIVNNDGKSW